MDEDGKTLFEMFLGCIQEPAELMEDYIVLVLKEGKFSDEERIQVGDAILKAIREERIDLETFSHANLLSILRFLAERKVVSVPKELPPNEIKGGMGGSVSQE